MSQNSPKRFTPQVSTGTFRAFANESYRFLWTANFLAYTSRWMQMTLLAWLVLELTDSPWLVSLIGFFVWMPCWHSAKWDRKTNGEYWLIEQAL